MATFGAKIDGELQRVEGKTADEIERKQNAVIQKYVGDKRTSSGQFSDPALFFN